MSDNRPANVRGPVLKWARERWGVTREEAAEALEVDAAVIDAWEAGAARPTSEQAVRLSDAYNVALADLLAPTPRAEPPIYDFRTVGGRSPQLLPEVKRALLSAMGDQEEATYVAEALELPVPPVLPESFSAVEDAEALGVAARSHFKVSVDDQLAWSDPYKALREWRRCIEDLGILVFSRPLPRLDCRGFSLWDESLLPVIVFSSREVPEARLFTLLHELCHVIRRSTGICDRKEIGDRASEEAFCNRFAAAVLMPPEVVLAANERARRPLDSGGPLTLDDVSTLARRMRVSRPAAAIRLNSLGHDAGGVLRRLLELEEDEADWQPKTDGRTGGPDFYAVKSSRVGRGYAGLILRGLEAGVIDIVDTCDALGVTVKQIAPLAEDMHLPVPSAALMP